MVSRNKKKSREKRSGRNFLTSPKPKRKSIKNYKLNNLIKNSSSRQQKRIIKKQPSARNKTDLSNMKIHRGPLNLNSITLRNPKIVYEEIIKALQEIGVTFVKS